MNFEQYLIESEIEDLKKELKDSDDYLKAPNGKKSNLPEKQWLMVRTKAFKRWFGDWDNDPENASKVLDKNGEPMIMYHGTPNIFDEFKYTSDKATTLETTKWMGFFFANNKEFASNFGNGNHIMEVFLNIRKPYSLVRNDVDEINSNSAMENEEFATKLEKKKYDGMYVPDYLFTDGGGKWDEYVTFKPKQIKSINNIGKFKKSSANINENNK